MDAIIFLLPEDFNEDFGSSLFTFIYLFCFLTSVSFRVFFFKIYLSLFSFHFRKFCHGQWLITHSYMSPRKADLQLALLIWILSSGGCFSCGHSSDTWVILLENPTVWGLLFLPKSSITLFYLKQCSLIWDHPISRVESYIDMTVTPVVLQSTLLSLLPSVAWQTIERLHQL